ncbi:MAG: cytochrome C oxidase subunit IV family protein [Planctomycetia bacterium]|nr:cytochrome C oxidase subunit IV family protein [Planctomycetia bacterium]
MGEQPNTPGTTPATAQGTDDPYGVRKDLDDPFTLVIVWIAVLGLALVNVGLSFAIGPTKFTLPLQLMIGFVQAGLVAYYFMHLKQGDKVVILTALSSLFWMGILFVLFLSDYMTRHIIVGG